MKALLVTVDAWRFDHADFLPDGTAVETTPRLDAFAEDAVAFSQAVSHGPATPYAFPGVFTSTLPLDHGGYETLGDDRTLVTEALADAGWRCAGFHANPWLGEQYGYARGYETYRDTGEFGLPLLDRGRTALIDRFGLDHPVYRTARRVYRHAQKPLRRLTSEGGSAASSALGTVRSMDDEAFAWVHLLAPHAPYDPPARHREAVGAPSLDATASTLVTRAQRDPGALDRAERTAVEALYAAAVRHADEQVGDLLDAVDDDALVVVTADHGEALFDHGQVGHDPALYDELLRVPLLVRPPAGTDRRVVDSQVRHVDLAPTILDYAGVPSPDSWRGRSLRPFLVGEWGTDDGGRPAVSEVASTKQTPGRVDADALQVAVRTPRRKLVADDDIVGGADVVGFDLRTDPVESDPIPDPAGARWDDLRDRLDRRLEAVSFDGPEVDRRDAAVRDRLEDLGYLD